MPSRKDIDRQLEQIRAEWTPEIERFRRQVKNHKARTPECELVYVYRG